MPKDRTITLTILTQTFDEFSKQAKTASSFLPYIQIDVMDGKFVPTVSFPERTEINDLGLNLQYELHLMVADPVAEMRRWQTVESVFRVLFHYEAVKEDPLRPITFARREGWEVGVVINPDTPLSAIESLLPKIDVLQFMTVYPGRQGAPFEPQVLEKIAEFTKRTSRPLCAVDGAINTETITQLRDAGVEIFNVGSFFTKAPDMHEAYEKLQRMIK